MAFVPWENFYTLVSPSVPSASGPVIDQALRKASRLFCKKTLVYQMDLSPVPIREGKDSYLISASSELIIVQPVQVRIGTQEVAPVLREDLPIGFESFDEGKIERYYFSLSKELVVFRSPDSTYSGKRMNIRVAVEPSLTSVNVESNFLESYGEIISMGALSSLFSMKSAPWYDPDQYAYNEGRFNESIGNVSINRRRDHSNAQLRVKYNKW